MIFEKVGVFVIAMFGVVPPVEVIFPEPVTDVTVPLPVPQGVAIVVSKPPMPDCTQFPLVRADETRFAAVAVPVNVGELTTPTVGAVEEPPMTIFEPGPTLDTEPQGEAVDTSDVPL